MASIYFPSLPEGDVVTDELIDRAGKGHVLKLFVDSGFTGASSLILSDELEHLASGRISAAQTSGALQGHQRRIIVNCRVADVAFHDNLIAILTDISSLALPPGVEGMTGLSFLRSFRAWGSERMDDGTWRFFLTNDSGVD